MLSVVVMVHGKHAAASRSADCVAAGDAPLAWLCAACVVGRVFAKRVTSAFHSNTGSAVFVSRKGKDQIGIFIYTTVTTIDACPQGQSPRSSYTTFLTTVHRQWLCSIRTRTSLASDQDSHQNATSPVVNTSPLSVGGSRSTAHGCSASIARKTRGWRLALILYAKQSGEPLVLDTVVPPP